MRPFFKVLILVVVCLASVSAWVKYRQELAGTIQTMQVPAGDTPTGDPNAPTATPTHTPTPEPTGVDTTAPQILSIELQQSKVDTTASSQMITATIHVTDDLSGLQRVTLRFVPDIGGTQYLDISITEDYRVNGDRRDGIYVMGVPLPKYSAHGRWYLSEVMISDNANNGAYGSGYLDGGVTQPEKVTAETQPLYFVNGKDSGPIAEPEPTPPFEIGPMPPDGGAATDENEVEESKVFLPGLRQ